MHQCYLVHSVLYLSNIIFPQIFSSTSPDAVQYIKIVEICVDLQAVHNAHHVCLLC